MQHMQALQLVCKGQQSAACCFRPYRAAGRITGEGLRATRSELRGSACASGMQGYGYGDVQRMQAPQPDMWESQSAAQQPQSAPSPPPPPLPQGDEFVGGASQGFFGEMPPRGAVSVWSPQLSTRLVSMLAAIGTLIKLRGHSRCLPMYCWCLESEVRNTPPGICKPIQAQCHQLAGCWSSWLLSGKRDP